MNSQYITKGGGGKNVATSYIESTEGAGINMNFDWFVNTNGLNYKVQNIQNVEGDEMFDKKVVVNADGTFGLKEDEESIQITIPDNLDISVASPADSTYTVNHIYPDPVPELGEEFNNLKNFMATVGNNDLIEMADNDFTIASIDEVERASIRNGVIKIIPKGGLEYSPQTSVTSNIVLPTDKNWTVMFKTSFLNHYRYSRGFKIGFIRGDQSSNVNAPETAVLDPHDRGYGFIGSGLNIMEDRYTGSHVIYTKVGRIINITIVTEKGLKQSVNIDAMTFLGDYKLCFCAGTTNSNNDTNSYSNIKYWIEQ